jgi:hypothetical protein
MMDKFKTKDGKEIEVTAEGSLGLLALGYRGLVAWRQKRLEAIKQKGQQPPIFKIEKGEEEEKA